MNTWPSLAGCLPTGRLGDGRLHTTATRTAQLLSDRLGDGHYSSASYDARAVMKNYCAFLHRNALRRARSNTGLTSRSMVPEGPVLSAACLLLRGQLTCLLSCPRWATRDGKLPAQTLKSMVPLSSIDVQPKWSKKRRAFGISRMMARRTARRQPDKARKTGGLTRQDPDVLCSEEARQAPRLYSTRVAGRGQLRPVGVAVEFSGKQPLTRTRRPAPDGQSRPAQRAAQPGSQRSNAAHRGRAWDRAPSHGQRTDALSAASIEPGRALSLRPGAL